ncbi:unnamed protein product, partial [Ectocarpus sp. 12 AP-2014]
PLRHQNSAYATAPPNGHTQYQQDERGLDTRVGTGGRSGGQGGAGVKSSSVHSDRGGSTANKRHVQACAGSDILEIDCTNPKGEIINGSSSAPGTTDDLRPPRGYTRSPMDSFEPDTRLASSAPRLPRRLRCQPLTRSNLMEVPPPGMTFWAATTERATVDFLTMANLDRTTRCGSCSF